MLFGYPPYFIKMNILKKLKDKYFRIELIRPFELSSIAGHNAEKHLDYFNSKLKEYNDVVDVRLMPYSGASYPILFLYRKIK